MKKFANKIDDLLTESLTRFAAAHADLVNLHLNPNFLTRKNKARHKVAIISGGGYGMLDEQIKIHWHSAGHTPSLRW